MCVAIAKIKGADCPDFKTLKACWDANPDGAGFSFNMDNGKVSIRKGFITFESFYQAFEEAKNKYNFKSRGLLIHFRIATHGAKNETMTHPFPVSNKVEELKSNNIVSKYAVAHNGIINLCSQISGELSDTAVFIQKYLKPISRYPRWFYNSKKMEYIDTLAKSKLALLNGKGEIQLIGEFKQETKGIYYSNSFFNYFKDTSDFYSNHKNYYYYYD